MEKIELLKELEKDLTPEEIIIELFYIYLIIKAIKEYH
jgi:hypothetical protein